MKDEPGNAVLRLSTPHGELDWRVGLDVAEEASAIVAWAAAIGGHARRVHFPAPYGSSRH
jgi:hypothetical protein